jgi:hypothetical protein
MKKKKLLSILFEELGIDQEKIENQLIDFLKSEIKKDIQESIKNAKIAKPINEKDFENFRKSRKIN